MLNYLTSSFMPELVNYLLNLIDEILDLSRIEAGQVDLLMQALSLEAVISDSLNWVADSWGVTVNFDPMTCRGLFVKADSLKLKQVLLNLETNAVKNNYENGNVDILGYMGQNGLVRICVSHTGIGISPDRISDLFQPFNRLGQEMGRSKVLVLIW